MVYIRGKGRDMENSPYVDEKQIKHLHELGGPSLVLKMIGLFFEHAPQRIIEIKEFESQNNWDGVFQSVHKLKSSAGNFGAQSLFELCGSLEEQIRSGKSNELSPQLRELETLLNGVLDELRHEKERIGE